LINQYSIPNGLKPVRRELKASESENQFKDRYSKQNLERLNLESRRNVLGSFKQNVGLQGSKIKPVIVGHNHISKGMSAAGGSTHSRTNS